MKIHSFATHQARARPSPQARKSVVVALLAASAEWSLGCADTSRSEARAVDIDNMADAARDDAGFHRASGGTGGAAGDAGGADGSVPSGGYAGNGGAGTGGSTSPAAGGQPEAGGACDGNDPTGTQGPVIDGCPCAVAFGDYCCDSLDSGVGFTCYESTGTWSLFSVPGLAPPCGGHPPDAGSDAGPSEEVALGIINCGFHP